VSGVLHTVLQMIEKGATHVGVATDHVIESFRNELWPGYKTSEGMEPALLAQFHPLEDALAAMGVVVWPMVELEADDALASAAHLAAADPRVEKVCIWTPDKDLAQCVREDRVVLLDRRRGVQLDAEGVRGKYGVDPASIPDWLALVGDAADGYPGIPRFGTKSAAAVLRRYLHIEQVPDDAAAWDVVVRGREALAESLRAHRRDALLYRTLATLRTDVPLPEDLEGMRWRGVGSGLAALCEEIGFGDFVGPGV